MQSFDRVTAYFVGSVGWHKIELLDFDVVQKNEAQCGEKIGQILNIGHILAHNSRNMHRTATIPTDLKS